MADQWRKRGTPHAISGLVKVLPLTATALTANVQANDTVEDRAVTGHSMIGAETGDCAAADSHEH